MSPLRLEELRGKQSTPSIWLGGTGEHSAVGKQERGGARGRQIEDELKGNGMILIDEVESILIFGNLMLFDAVHSLFITMTV